MIDVTTSGHYVGDCRELLARLPEGSVQTCVTSPPYLCSEADRVQLLRPLVVRMHRDAEFGGTSTRSHVPASDGDTSNLAPLLHITQRKRVSCLLLLHAQERQQRAQAVRCPQVGSAPRVERTPALKARLGDVDRATERLSEEVDNMRCDLPERDSLRIRRLLGVSDLAHAVRRASDSNGSIGINGSSEIGERFRAVHRRSVA